MLLDLHGIVKPTLSLMDAVEAMEGNGPSAGNVRRLGLLLASESALALDFAALKAIDFKASEIPTVALAEKLGLIDYSNIVVVLPEGIDFPAVKDFKRARSFIFSSIGRVRFLIKFAKPLLGRKPALIPEKCISCGKCFQICPARAIDFKTKKPVFDYKKCIRCFCCHEVCAEKAIEIKESLAINVLKKIKAFG